MLMRSLLLAGLAALPAHADVAEAVGGQALPGYAAFASATAGLATVAEADCGPEAMKPSWNAAFDAWMAVSHLRLGPVEEDGRALAIAFWPDPKGAGQRAVAALLAGDGPPLDDAAAFAEVSVAGRGLFALERLLYDAPDSARACPLRRAIARDLSRMASETSDAWIGGYGAALTTAGAEGNDLFLSTAEARQAMFTQLVTGLDFTVDERLGRPLGTFDRPRPERAEARLSGRSMRNVRLSLAALTDLTVRLLPDSPRTQAALDRASGLADGLDDDALARVGDPQVWLKVQILQQAVDAARDAALAEIGPALQVGVGFNASDGD
jgi:uncharacterized protein